MYYPGTEYGPEEHHYSMDICDIIVPCHRQWFGLLPVLVHIEVLVGTWAQESETVAVFLSATTLMSTTKTTSNLTSPSPLCFLFLATVVEGTLRVKLFYIFQGHDEVDRGRHRRASNTHKTKTTRTWTRREISYFCNLHITYYTLSHP